MKIDVRKLSDEELKKKNVSTWPIWECDVSEFDWYYDTAEQCYFLKGSAVVKASDQEVAVKRGDFVTFPKGLKCVWKVKEAVKKHYKFK